MISELALKFYQIDYNDKNFTFLNSLFNNKLNYNFLNILRHKIYVSRKHKSSELFFNIENYTHLREYKFLIDICLKLDFTITVYSSNLDLKNYFTITKNIKLINDCNIGLRNGFLFFLFFLFNPFLYKTIRKFKSKNYFFDLRYIFNNKSKFLFFYFSYKKLLNEISPKFCFIGNDLTFHGRMLSLISKSKTISFQHGNIYDDYKSKNHIVDIFFCYSSISRDILKKSYRGELIVSGSFFHKKMQFLINDIEYNFQNKMIFENYTLIAFSGYGHSTSLKNYEIQINYIEKLVLSNTEDFFVFKLHPKENIVKYSRILNEKNVFFIESDSFLNSHSIYPLLKKANKLITGISTVSIEAMIMKKDVICVDPLHEYCNNELVQKDLLIYVDNYKSLDLSYKRDHNFNKNSYLYACDFFGLNCDFDFNNFLLR
jgi:hypothetical protein